MGIGKVSPLSGDPGIQGASIVSFHISTQALHVCCSMKQKAWRWHTSSQIPLSEGERHASAHT